MSYLVLARKWRPQRFDEVVGQEHVTKTLANAIAMDRVAHAFVFSGLRGVGKTSLARIMAKSLNCSDGPTVHPCGTCESCRSIVEGRAIDVVEIDGASNNSVDDIRELRETVPYKPIVGRFKIYVIDEVHMLSASAFNALLKTLEEPPPHVKFIFATTEAHKIPGTILSRCQRYDFRRIPTSAITERLKAILGEEKIEFDENAVALIGREAEGSMRDALSILDQVLASATDKITGDNVAALLGIVDGYVYYDISRAVLAEDPRKVLEIVRDVDNQGYDLAIFAKGLLEHFRNLVVAGICGDDRSMLDLPDKEIEDIVEQASAHSTDTLHRILKHFAEAVESISRSSHPRIILEASLARLADLGELIPAAVLVERLEALAERQSGPSSSTPPNNPSSGPGSPNSRSRPTGTSAQTTKSETRHQPDEPPPRLAPRPTGDVGWQDALDELKREQPSIASILECGVPKMPDDRTGLVIQYAARYSAVAELARERAADIATWLENRMGRRVRVEVQMNEAAVVPEVTQKRIEREEQLRKREDAAKDHPLVRQVQAELGGKIMRVRLETD